MVRIKNNTADWSNVSKNYNLSEEFIDQYSGRLDWYYISYYQKLSQYTIEKYKHLVSWRVISQCQKLSEAFIYKNKDHIRYDWLVLNKELKNYSEGCKDFIAIHLAEYTSHVLDAGLITSYMFHNIDTELKDKYLKYKEQYKKYNSLI